MAKLLSYNATLAERIDITPLLAVFRVRPDEPMRARDRQDGPAFVPGQYLTIGLNREPVDTAGDETIDTAGDETVDTAGDAAAPSVRRPMSIASAPEQTDFLEFYIRYVGRPESELPLTHLLWRRRQGDRLYLRPVATGRFTIEHTVGLEDRRLKVMVAAGTGLAPFLSIVRSRVLRDPDVRLDDIAILHGASYPDDLGYRDELESLAADHGLKYVPTISRPAEAPEWNGATGRVEQLLEASKLEETERLLGLGTGGLRPERAAVMVCGLQGTIANTLLNLIPRGFVPADRRLRRALGVPAAVPSTLFFEQYDTDAVVDLEDDALMTRLRAQLHAAGSWA